MEGLGKKTAEKNTSILPTSPLNVAKNCEVLSTVGSRSRLPLIISICFAVVTGSSAIGTLAWVTGQLTLAEVNPLYVPIAPLGILFLILLGASSFLYGVRPGYSWFRIQAAAVGALVVPLTLVIIRHAVVPGEFEHRGIDVP